MIDNGKIKNILAIIGSASQRSSNERLVENIASKTADFFRFTVYHDLKKLPHFDPALSADTPPEEVLAFRQAVETADGVIICTPEYVFSIPSGLKNAIEWCISTTVFTDKPIGLITASADGEEAHKQLTRIMKTVMAVFNDETTLLIRGIKGKINAQGELTDTKTKDDLARFINAFKKSVDP